MRRGVETSSWLIETARAALMAGPNTIAPSTTTTPMTNSETNRSGT